VTTTINVTCPVDTQGDFGSYANAFRIMQDGNDVLLDFCVYSEQENSAKVVARVRIHPTFLNVVISRIQGALQTQEPIEDRRIYVMPEVRGLN
jgi:stress response protein SCP2